MDRIKPLVVAINGFSLDRENKSKFQKLRNSIDMSVVAVFPVITIYTMCMSYPSAQDMADHLLGLVTSIFAFVTRSFYYFNTTPIYRLHDRLQILSKSVSLPEKQVIKDCGKRLPLVSMALIGSIGSCIFLVDIAPGLISLIQFLRLDKSAMLYLPFLVKFPKTLLDSNVKYAMSYSFLVYMVIVAGSSHFIDVLYLERSVLLKGYFTVFQNRLIGIDFTSRNFKRDLTHLVDFHNLILDTVKDFQEAFGAMVSVLSILAVSALSASLYGLLLVCVKVNY